MQDGEPLDRGTRTSNSKGKTESVLRPMKSREKNNIHIMFFLVEYDEAALVIDEEVCIGRGKKEVGECGG